MIICLLGAFFENALKKQNPPLSSLSLHWACMSGGKLCPFFQASSTVHALFSREGVLPFRQFNGICNFEYKSWCFYIKNTYKQWVIATRHHKITWKPSYYPCILCNSWKVIKRPYILRDQKEISLKIIKRPDLLRPTIRIFCAWKLSDRGWLIDTGEYS